VTSSGRTFSDYGEALVMSLEEEISGEVYFARLAEFFCGRERQALLMLASVEAVTAEAIRPLLGRYGLGMADPEKLQAAGLAEADRRQGRTWTQLIEEMATTFPAFVDEFECIERLAPPEDKEFMRILVEHEVAAVSFAKLEARSDPVSLRPLEEFLGRHRSHSGAEAGAA